MVEEDLLTKKTTRFGRCIPQQVLSDSVLSSLKHSPKLRRLISSYLDSVLRTEIGRARWIISRFS
jgi:hypothetical protein